MTHADDAAAIRHAVHTADACTAQTTSQLKAILGYPMSKEEAADLTRRFDAVRPVVSNRTRTQSAAPASQLDSRQRHNLATDVFNSSLKILSEAARRQVTNAKPAVASKNVKALRQISNPPALKRSGASRDISKTDREPITSPPQSLAAAVECSLIACHYLSHYMVVKAANKPAPPYQLPSGMLLLAAKVLALDFDKHAIRLLSLVKRALEPSTDVQATVKETLSSLLDVSSKPGDPPERTPLLVTYFGLILKVMALPGYAVSVAHALPRLDPHHPCSPCMVTLSCSSDNAKVAKQLETQAQSLTLTARNTALTPLVRLKLHSFALQVRQRSWPLISHVADLAAEVLEPLLQVLSTYATESKEPQMQIYSAATIVYEQVMGKCPDQTDKSPDLATRTKLCHLLEDLAQNESDKTRWADQILAFGGASPIHVDCLVDLANMASRVDLLMAKNRALQRDMLAQCEKSLNKALTEPSSVNPADLVLPITVLCRSTTQAMQSAKTPRADSFILAETAFLCVNFTHGIVTTPLLAGQASMSNKNINKIIEATVFAAGQWLTVLDAPPELTYAPSNQCIELLASAGNDVSEKTLLHLSNIFWLAYQKHTKTNACPPSRLINCLESSLAVLHAAPLTMKEAGFYALKLERLAEIQVRERFATESYDTMSRAIKYHISSSGVLQSLAEIEPVSVLGPMSREKGAVYLRRLLRLQLDVIERGQLACVLYDDIELKPQHQMAFLEAQLTVELAVLSESAQKPLSNRVRAILNATLARMADMTDTLTQARVTTLCQVVLVSRLYDHRIVDQALIKQTASQVAAMSENNATIECLNKLMLGQRDDHCIDSQIMAWTQLVHNADMSGDWSLLYYMLAAVSLRLTALDDLVRAYKVSTILQKLQARQSDRSSELRSLIYTSTAASALGLSTSALENIERGQQLLKQTELKSDTFDLMEFHLAAFDIFTSHGDFDRAQVAFAAFHTTSGSAPPRRFDKTRFYLKQAQAGFLYSKYAMATGNIADALHYGKECIRLYKSLVAAIVKQRPATAQHQSATSVDGLVDRVAAMAIADTGAVAEDPKLQLVQAQLFQVFCYMADVHMDQGSKADADHFIEKAKDYGGVSSTLSRQRTIARLELRSVTLASSLAGIDACLERSLEDTTCSPDLSLVRYCIARGEALLLEGEHNEALAEFEKAKSTIQEIVSAVGLTLHWDAVHIQEQPSSRSATRPSKGSNTMVQRQNRSGKSAPRVIKPQKSISRASAPPAERSHVVLDALLLDIGCGQALAHLAVGRIENAQAIASSVRASGVQAATVRSELLQCRLNLAKVNEQLAADVKYNTIPEAAIPLPALLAAGSTASDTMCLENKKTSKAKTAQKTCKVASLLSDTAQLTLRTASNAVKRLPLQIGYQSCSLATTAVMLWSTMGKPAGAELHPTTAARTFHLPTIDALQRQLTAEAVDISSASLQELLNHAANSPRSSAAPLLTSAEYQRDFIDILPKQWTVVSLGLSEDLSELRLARLGCEQIPFVLRLPLRRQSGNDMDDDSAFDFETGRKELQDIIECSNFSCHSPIDTSVKGAKTQWWTEREALDGRLHELLINIENIWLGGFRGIFSLHQRRVDLLARFRKSFDKILDRHLPSRSGSRTTKAAKKLVLDSNILELFVGLGNVSSQEPFEVEEQVLDLLHFVLDTLSFNGEANANDEVDIDGMAIDVLEAIRHYSEATTGHNEQRHLILVLDKKLHNFPWESMACLKGQSVSRVGSMLHIRERLLSMRRRGAADRAIVPRQRGTYVVNPSGDLTKTQLLLEPALAPLLDKVHEHSDAAVGWSSISGRAPVGDEIARSLSDSDIFLFFGHGSGNQYISNRSVRRLQRTAQVVWLMGCSSGTVIENGDLEPTSVPLSYLLAGESLELAHGLSTKGADEDRVDSANESDHVTALPSRQLQSGREGVCMAVLATLWDVTDKDIDHFSLRVGQKWGLFAEDTKTSPMNARPKMSTPAEATVPAPKTPGRKATRASAPKTPAPRDLKTPSARTVKAARAAKTPRTTRAKRVVEEEDEQEDEDTDLSDMQAAGLEPDRSLSMAVAQSRDVCYLRYLNGAAAVVYGVPVYLGD